MSMASRRCCGDQLMIEVRGVDDRGKVRLSMKAVDQATGEDISNKPVEAAPPPASSSVPI